MIDQSYLMKSAEVFGIVLTEEMAERFDCYAQLLVEWNEKINLTAIMKPEEIVIKHFVDSLLLSKVVELEKGARVIDVGTGAGFPGVPLKILRPDLHLTLLDSLNKRIQFLSRLSAALGQENQCIHSRAEDGGKKPELRERFHLATARAVARLRELAEYCLPFVQVGGCFVALKGYEIEEELVEAKRAISLLGGEIVQVEKFTLPDGSKRGLVVVKKISQTLTKYPRPAAKMTKQPL